MKANRIAGPLVTAAAIVVAWQGLHWLGKGIITSPWDAVHKLYLLGGTADFWGNVTVTAYAFGVALVISIVCGIVVGMSLGISRLATAVAEPILINLYSIPKVTLYPLVLLCFGLGISAKVAFGVMHGMIPITIFTMSAIRQMKPVYLRSAQTMHLGPVQTAVTVVLPAILPEVLSGIRLGLSLTLLGVLIGEMFASVRGLGFMITSAMGRGDMDTIMAIALLLSVFAIAANRLLLQLDRSPAA